ncbi:MAG: addiction module protein [Planctomycetes bacterium]|nr:addiction module protein [Planctomycetota bacterium]
MNDTNAEQVKLTGDDAVFDAALSLPDESRAVLAEKLLDSLDADSYSEITPEMVEEAERRLQAYREGKIKSVPGEEVMKSLLSGFEK